MIQMRDTFIHAYTKHNTPAVIALNKTKKSFRKPEMSITPYCAGAVGCGLLPTALPA